MDGHQYGRKSKSGPISTHEDSVNTLFKIFIKDNEVSDLIQGGMEQLVVTIFICEVYAKEHLKGRTPDNFTNTPLSVRKLLPQLLAEVFKFFYHATKHVKSHRVST